MSKKLTLNIDEDLIDFAHFYSLQNNLSISRLFEEYLYRLKNADKAQTLNSKTYQLYGIFQSKQIPDKKELRKIFHEKTLN